MKKVLSIDLQKQTLRWLPLCHIYYREINGKFVLFIEEQWVLNINSLTSLDILSEGLRDFPVFKHWEGTYT